MEDVSQKTVLSKGTPENTIIEARPESRESLTPVGTPGRQAPKIATVAASIRVSTPHLDVSKFRGTSHSKSVGLVKRLQGFNELDNDNPDSPEKRSKKWYQFYMHVPGQSSKVLNRFTLHFVDEVLEQQYKVSSHNRNMGNLKIMCSVMLFLLFIYGLADFLYAKDDLVDLLILRYAVFLPILSILLAFIYSRFFARKTHLWLLLYTFIFGINFIISGVLSDEFGEFYYQSILWPITFAFLYLRIHTFLSLGLSILYILAILPVWKSAMIDLLFDRCLAYQIIYFAFYSYMFEIRMRKEYLLRLQVNRERENLKKEKEISEDLLLNILPKPVAERVKMKETVADGFQHCTVLFAKVVDIGAVDLRVAEGISRSSGLASRKSSNQAGPIRMNPVEIFMLLNDIFTMFDTRVQMFGLEKIKTMGQVYMAVGGVPVPREDHCEAVAEFALDMIETVKKFNLKHKTSVGLRIGIHSLKDGVPHPKRYISRQFVLTNADSIKVTETVFKALEGKFTFEAQGPTDVKGKGKMNTFHLTGKMGERGVQIRNVLISTVRKSQNHQSKSVIDTKEFYEDTSVLQALTHTKMVNKFTLKYLNQDKEPRFDVEYAKNSRRTVGLAMILMVLFHLFSTVEDVTVIERSHFRNYFILKGSTMIVYLGFLVVMYKFGWIYERYMQQYAFLSALINLGYSLAAGAFISSKFYWVVANSIFFIFLFTKLKYEHFNPSSDAARFIFAVPLGWFSFVAFKVVTNIPGSLRLQSDDNIIATCLFFALCAVLGLAHYMSEYLERRDFFMILELEDQRHQVHDEKEKSEELLLNILPKPIVAALKGKRGEIVPEEFADVTVLCADIVGFTDFCSDKSPAEVVYNLNELFSQFDALVPKYNLEKIKTIGDAYIVAGGLPIRSKDHATQVASFALAMLECVDIFNRNRSLSIKIRVGIHSGSCVAGLVGSKRFTYDILGEAISVASLAESTGFPGRIHVTDNTRRRLRSGQFVLEERTEPVNAGTKGKFKTYFLLTQVEDANENEVTSVSRSGAEYDFEGEERLDLNILLDSKTSQGTPRTSISSSHERMLGHRGRTQSKLDAVFLNQLQSYENENSTPEALTTRSSFQTSSRDLKALVAESFRDSPRERVTLTPVESME